MELPATSRPLFSVIVPVYNGGQTLVACLQALRQSDCSDWELIVVDDGSTDQSRQVAQEFGARVLSMPQQSGPAAARNLGAQVAQGEYLCFIDADCTVHRDTLTQFQTALGQYPDVEALFGSYDQAPYAQNFVAQFKNLMHHYVHQTGQSEATTFWSGCGVFLRSRFLELGGFDVERYPRPCIEDIELGYRLRQAGGQIRLVKSAQVKHHKAWTLGSLIKTDVCDRGIPWTQLLLSYPSGLVNDLNLQVSHRLSVVAVYLLVLCLPLGFYQVGFWLLTFGLIGSLLFLNFALYVFFYRQRGLVFALASVWMHWLYYLYSGVAFGCGYGLYWLNRANSASTHRLVSRQP